MSRPLSGQTVVFTGFRDHALSRRITNLGGAYRDSISSATTTVICRDASLLYTNKATAARTRGLRVLTREEFTRDPCASGGAIAFGDAAFLAQAQLPAREVASEVTRARGIAAVAARAPSAAEGQPAAPRLGASRLGGEPDMPSSLEWPRAGGVPLAFIAQVHLSAAAPYDGSRALLPRHGSLLFFAAGDYAGEPGGWGAVSSDEGRRGCGGGARHSGARPSIGDARHPAGDARHTDTLPPSRVLFVAEGAHLQRRVPPSDLPAPHRLPLTWLQFEVGAPRGAGDGPVPEPRTSEPSRKRGRGIADPAPRSKREQSTCAAAESAARGSSAAGSSRAASTPAASPAGSAPALLHLLGPPVPARSVRDVCALATEVWTDMQGERASARGWTTLLQVPLAAAEEEGRVMGTSDESATAARRRGRGAAAAGVSAPAGELDAWLEEEGARGVTVGRSARGVRGAPAVEVLRAGRSVRAVRGVPTVMAAASRSVRGAEEAAPPPMLLAGRHLHFMLPEEDALQRRFDRHVLLAL